MPNNYISHPSGILVPVDPYEDSVVLRIKFNGPNGSNTIVDEKGHPLSLVGGPILSADKSATGSTSWKLDGSTQGAKATDPSDDFRFGLGDFTQEGLVYITALSAVWNVCGNGSQSGDSGLTLYVNALGALVSSSSNNVIGRSGNGAVTINAWHHLSMSRVGGLGYLHVDGNLVTAPAGFSAGFNIQDGVFNIGFQPAAYYSAGYIQQARITKGVGRYNSSNYLPNLTTPW